MFEQRDGGRSSDDGACLKGLVVFDAIYACTATDPGIGVQRDPNPGFYVIAQMSFEGADGLLRLRPCAGKECVARPEFIVRHEEPYRSIGV